MMHSMSLKESGTCANLANSGLDNTWFWKHLSGLCSWHHLAINNRMNPWSDSSALTCFPLVGGRNIVYYIIEIKVATQTIPPCPISADNTYASITLGHKTPSQPPSPSSPTSPLWTIVPFTHELGETFSQHVQQRLYHLDPIIVLHALISQLSTVIHSSAWKEMYQRFCTIVSLGETTQKIASKNMQTLAHTRLRRPSSNFNMDNRMIRWGYKANTSYMWQAHLPLFLHTCLIGPW